MQLHMAQLSVLRQLGKMKEQQHSFDSQCSQPTCLSQ